MKGNDLKPLDKKILLNLIEDSSQNLTDIAEKVDATRQTVSQRIKNLIEKNIIKSYTISFNTNLFEEMQEKAYIFFQEESDAKTRKENEKEIIEMPQVTGLFRLYGKYAGIIEILVKNNDEADAIVEQILSLKGIIVTETYFVRKLVKDNKNSPILNLLSS